MSNIKFKLKDKNKTQLDNFRKYHPKATQGLSDDEVAQLGNSISEVHDDNTKRKFKDIYTDKSGQRYLIVDDDGEDVAIPIFKSGKK